MKSTLYTFLMVTATIPIHLPIHAQLSLYAGPDTILCASNLSDYQPGNFVMIEGNYDSIRYTWSCEYPTSAGSLYASSFLDDTTASNPTFVSAFDTLTFTLEIVDDNGNKASDTITFIVSQFIFCLADCIKSVHEGDSVQIGHCISGGIPPYIYSWDHAESLSDPSLANPWAKPEITTEYFLTLTDSAGCIASSRCIVTVIPASVETNNSLYQQVNVFPNPIHNNSSITIKNFGNRVVEIRFYNLNGQLVYERYINKDRNRINSGDFQSGVYIYTIKAEGVFIQTGKIVIE